MKRKVTKRWYTPASDRRWNCNGCTQNLLGSDNVDMCFTYLDSGVLVSIHGRKQCVPKIDPIGEFEFRGKYSGR